MGRLTRDREGTNIKGHTGRDTREGTHGKGHTGRDTREGTHGKGHTGRDTREGTHEKGHTGRDKVGGRDGKGSLKQPSDPDRWPPYKFKVRGHSLYFRIHQSLLFEITC